MEVLYKLGLFFKNFNNKNKHYKQLNFQADQFRHCKTHGARANKELF